MNPMKNFLGLPPLQSLLLIPLAAAGVFLSGCATTPKPIPYNIQVNLDQPLKGKSVVVDLVGVNPASLPRWEAYSMSSYWKEGDPMRRDSAADRVSFNFVSADSLSHTLSSKDPQWKAWKAKGVTHVLVLADLPPSHTDKPGDSDDRRLKLPLDAHHWASGSKTLNVLVQQSGIQVLTPIRP